MVLGTTKLVAYIYFGRRSSKVAYDVIGISRMLAAENLILYSKSARWSNISMPMVI